jgi:hypothetical protein
MRLVTAVVLAMSWAGITQGPPAHPCIEVVVKTEARRLAGQDVSEQTLRNIESVLPDGSAEVRYITDGRAVQSTLSGRMFGFDDGTVRLLPRGSSDLHVLNPKDRTYRLEAENWRLFPGQKREFQFQRSGMFKNMFGHKAYQVTGLVRVEVPPLEGANPQVIHEVRAEIDNWCTSDLKVPAAMAKMMDLTQRLVGKGDPQFAQYREACPLALQAAVRLSLFPGFEIVSTTKSIRQLSQVPPGTFQLPEGYRPVAKASGGGTRQ